MSVAEFSSKVAVVTGAGSGIGQRTAIQLAENGANVCLIDISKSNVEKTKQQIELNGNETIVVNCNICDPVQVKQAMEQVFDKWKRIDIVFANAGIAGTLAPIETMDIEDWDNTIHTNLNGTFYTLKYSIPFMKVHGGSIIITSSVSGNRIFSQSGFSAYSTSKAAEVALMKMAALELAQYKIRVNAICPGAIKTNIGKSIHKEGDLKKISIPIEFPEGDQPLEHGPGQTNQVANLVNFLASSQSSHITGTEIFIDGAESLLR
jgi:NAD(P)-dependent dehydrogenase (short-subunit alcohol dehydrogenase family)